MSNRYLLSPAAQTDLEQIWDYTYDRWGVDQAEKYLRETSARHRATGWTSTATYDVLPAGQARKGGKRGASGAFIGERWAVSVPDGRLKATV